jgi:hypothetical protein
MSSRLLEVLIAAAIVVLCGYLVIDLLWIIDGLRYSKQPPFILFTLAGGALIGTSVWLFEGSPKGNPDVAGNVSVGDFFRSVTMRTPEGKVFLWGSMANVLLAIALFASAGAVPVTGWVAWAALLWPGLMFVVHARIITLASGRWFGTVMQASWALLPAVKVLYDLKVITA